MDPYRPVFRVDVYVNNPDGSTTPVNPEYCLYDHNAAELAALLGANGYPCTVVQGPPLGNFGEEFSFGFSFSSTVAWLMFSGLSRQKVDPAYERAGALGAFWSRATNTETGETDQKTALRNAIADIENVIKGN